MKTLYAAALAFLLACAPAFAQQTAIHSVPIGKGAGNTGFNAAVPGTAGQPLVSQGPSTDPAFGTIANSGFTSGAANTAKGSLNGTNVVDLPLPSCTANNQAWKYTSGVGINCSTVTATGGYDMPINMGLSASASGNALTITLTQASGAAPSGGSPVIVPFRSTTATTGTVTFTAISATQSITIPNGATLGTSNGVPFRVWIFEEYNGGAPELAVATCSNTTTVFPCAAWDTVPTTSTTIGGASNTGGTLYATAGVAADAVRIIGYCTFSSGQTVAGAWASSCTGLHIFGPGVVKPGGTMQTVYAQGAGASNSTNVAAIALAAPAISLSSAVNLVQVIASGQINGTNATAGVSQLFRGSTGLGVGALNASFAGSAGTINVPFGMNALDAPGVSSSLTYSLKFSSSNNSTSVSVSNPTIQVTEIQG